MPKKKTAAKKTSAKKKAMTKAAFIRSLPADMPATDVIAKGSEAGIKLNAMAVYKTRSNARKAKKGGSTGKSSAKKASTAPKMRGDKKNRVLDLVAKNPDWTADQVAKAVKCSTTYVYSVWKKKPKASASNGTPSASNGAVTAFYRAVKSVGGIAQAKELLANIEAFQNA